MKFVNEEITNELEQYLDGRVGTIRYIKKKTFEKAVQNGELNYNVTGKTKLKEVDKDKNSSRRLLKIIRENDAKHYLLEDCKITRLIGYIPTEKGTFVEYRKFNLIPFILLGILIIGLLLTLILNWNNWFGKTNIDNTPGGIGYEVGQTKKDKDKNGNDQSDVIDFPEVTMPGYSSLTMKANTTKIDTINFFNPSKNDGWYDLSFELEVDTNNDGVYETIYKSAKIAPGYRIDDFTITNGLSVGTYPARILIYPYYVKNDSIKLNNGVLELELKVE